MPSLKDFRVRIRSVKSTQKITAAMKMVAASRLRRAQEQAEAARPYAEHMGKVLANLAGKMAGRPGAPRLLAGTGKDDVHLLVVATSDKGLAGGFNASILRETRRHVRDLLARGKQVKIMTVGRKARDNLRRDQGKLIVESFTELGRKRLAFSEAKAVADRVLAMYEAGQFDVCTVIFNRFKSAIAQIVTLQQLIPFAAPARTEETAGGAVYEFEPDEETILSALLPNNLAVQIYTALLESSASEQGARMTAMDSASKNAGEVIDTLTLTMNRVRQASITREIIEVVSGAQALNG